MATRNGMWFKKTTSQTINEAQWWNEKTIRRQGGYDFDKSNIPAEVRWIPKGTLLKLDKTTGKVKVLKTAEVTAVAEAETKTIKVKDNGILMAGDVLNGSTITKIVVAEGIATLTVDKVNVKLNVGDVVSDLADENEVALGFQYETNDLRDNDYPQATPTLVAMEIEKDTLPLPISDKLIEALNKPGIGMHLFREQ